MIPTWYIVGVLIFLFSVWIWNIVAKYRLVRAQLHDRILYNFCSIRDEMAEAAIEKEVSEDSETFDIFYRLVGQIIHTQHVSGNCFNKLVRFVSHYIETKGGASGDGDEALNRELAETDSKRVRRLAAKFCDTMESAVYASYHLILIDRIMRRLPSFVDRMLSRRWIFSKEQREILDFCLSVQRAVPLKRPSAHC